MGRLLIVHHDAPFRALLRELLEDTRHEVIEAATTAAGVSVLRASSPCVALFTVDPSSADDTGATGLLGAVLHAGGAQLVHTHNFLFLAPPRSDVPPALTRLLRDFHVPVVPQPADPAQVLTLVLDLERQLPRTAPGQAT